MVAYTYPLLNIFWTMLVFFGFFIFIYLLIIIFMDIFRSSDLSGWAKALWIIFIIILPFIGILVYLIARGSKMHAHAEQDAADQQAAFDAYVKQAAGNQSAADQLKTLADLKDSGAISQAEFDEQKKKLIGS